MENIEINNNNEDKRKNDSKIIKDQSSSFRLFNNQNIIKSHIHLSKTQNYLEKKEFPLAHLIIINDDPSDYNEMPYTKALRNDKRNFFYIFFIVLFNKIDLIQLIAFREEFQSIEVSINLFILSTILDLFFNALLYNDDIISQKYHKNGKLDSFTEILLSLVSNIISYFLLKIINKLTHFDEYFELIKKEIKVKEELKKAVNIGLKIMNKTMKIFVLINLIINCVVLYYLSLFCAIYPKSQQSFFKNYGTGVAESFLMSAIIALFVAGFRKISLKCKIKRLYETSRFIDNFL